MLFKRKLTVLLSICSITSFALALQTSSPYIPQLLQAFDISYASYGTSQNGIKIVAQTATYCRKTHVIMLLYPCITQESGKKDLSWKIKGEKAYIYPEKIMLEGAVSVSPSTATHAPFSYIKTSQLTLYPQRGYAQTQKKVYAKMTTGIISSQGLTIDFKKNKITLPNHLKVRYS